MDSLKEFNHSFSKLQEKNKNNKNKIIKFCVVVFYKSVTNKHDRLAVVEL